MRVLEVGTREAIGEGAAQHTENLSFLDAHQGQQQVWSGPSLSLGDQLYVLWMAELEKLICPMVLLPTV